MKDRKSIVIAYIVNLLIGILLGVIGSIYILNGGYLLVIIATMLSYCFIHFLGWGTSKNSNKNIIFNRALCLFACVVIGLVFYNFIPFLASARIINPMLASAILSLDLLSKQSILYLLIMVGYIIVGAIYLRRVWMQYYEE